MPVSRAVRKFDFNIFRFARGKAALDVLFIASLACALTAGCKKHVAASATPAPDQTASSNSAPETAADAPVAAPETPAEVVIPENGDINATLAQLSKELHRSIARTHYLPTSFEDFVAHAHVQVPPPPPGKKFAINRQWRIVLENR